MEQKYTCLLIVQIVPYNLCWGNVSKTGFNGYIYDFSVDYNSIDVNHKKEMHK